jgi:hypothetical protein
MHFSVLCKRVSLCACVPAVCIYFIGNISKIVISPLMMTDDCRNDNFTGNLGFSGAIRRHRSKDWLLHGPARKCVCTQYVRHAPLGCRLIGSTGSCMAFCTGLPCLISVMPHCKKRLAIFSSPAEMLDTELSLAGSNQIIPGQGEFG